MIFDRERDFLLSFPLVVEYLRLPPAPHRSLSTSSSSSSSMQLYFSSAASQCIDYPAVLCLVWGKAVVQHEYNMQQSSDLVVVAPNEKNPDCSPIRTCMINDLLSHLTGPGKKTLEALRIPRRSLST
jgi:hypothetical protein